MVDAFTVIFIDGDDLDQIDSSPIEPVIVESDLQEFSVIEVPSALIPSDAEFNTVRVKIQEITVSDGHLSINRLFGEYVILNLESDVTFLEVLNWAPWPYFSRIILEIYNKGNFSISWPNWILWSRNRIPEVTDLGNDCLILTKSKDGVTVKGSIIGMNYPIP